MADQFPESICIVRLSALGDLFLALPAVQALSDNLPHTRITWLVERRFLPVVEHLSDRIELYPVDGPNSLAELRRIRRDFSRRRFSILLAMQAKLRSNLIYPLIQAERKIGFDVRRARDGQGFFINERIPRADQHLADGFLAFVRKLGVAPGETKPCAPPLTSEALAWRQAIIGDAPYLVLNTSSSKAERSWALALQREFLQRLPETGWRGRVILSGSHREEADELAAIVPDSLNLAGATDLPQLLALLAGARLLVSPDSGPVHIARAYDVPVVGLYAVARSALCGPWQKTEYCVDVFDEAVRTLLHRDPAKVDWHTRVHDARAMQLVTVDAVLAQTARVLARQASPDHGAQGGAIPA
ncbi:MAG: Lipopolysaccharide core heptosyltransferase RfaQ [Betaproteobacteria bacterium ADurb.Bin341]|nr:MAG: Lipopolysaccharide core heptosyltransferase RfaQ [Betaproteobacteria bacterium ADurb.Bin341]